MNRMKNIFLIGLVLLSFNAVLNGQTAPERQWPVYRGYMSSGILDNTTLPDHFSFDLNQNIRWKTEVPGLGLSSPVIWDNKLFITTAVSQADKEGFKPGIYGDVAPVDDSSVHEWKVLCYDKNTGRLIWERTSYTGVPGIKRHPKSTHANTTIATDGKYLAAFFGSEGLYCYDMNGNLQWKKNFGILKSVFFAMQDAEWEFASSPIIHKGVLVVQCDVLENSFIAAFDLKTGMELWRTSRDEYPGWCTPNIYQFDGKTYVVVNGYKHRGSYELSTGKERWRMSGGGDIQIPTPVIGDSLIFFNSAHGPSSPVFAVRTSAAGDITLNAGERVNAGIKWSIPRSGSYMQTLLLYRNRLYNTNWNGMVQCFNPLTGEEIYHGKLGASKSFVASPVASDGRIYIVDEEGTIYILKAGDNFQLIDEIPIRDICMTAPALTDGMIIFRTQHYLIAAGKK